MYDTIKKAAAAFGFAEAFFLAPLKLDFWRIQAEKWGVGASLHREPAAEAGVCCQMLDLFPGYAAAVASEEPVGSLRRYTLESLLEPWMQERSIT